MVGELPQLVRCLHRRPASDLDKTIQHVTTLPVPSTGIHASVVPAFYVLFFDGDAEQPMSNRRLATGTFEHDGATLGSLEITQRWVSTPECGDLFEASYLKVEGAIGTGASGAIIRELNFDHATPNTVTLSGDFDARSGSLTFAGDATNTLLEFLNGFDD